MYTPPSGTSAVPVRHTSELSMEYTCVRRNEAGRGSSARSRVRMKGTIRAPSSYMPRQGESWLSLPSLR